MIRLAIVEDDALCREELKSQIDRFMKEKGYRIQLTFFQDRKTSPRTIRQISTSSWWISRCSSWMG